MTTALPSSAEEAYDALAPAYDQFTYRNDYGTWLPLLLSKLESAGLKHGRLLDVGCGSGKAFPEMLRRKWEIVGCDISAAMLALAKEKSDGRVELHQSDMRDLPVYGQFDLVWALNDAVNYLVGDGELELALRGMRVNLAADGLMLFDCNSLATLRAMFSQEAVVERGDGRWTWSGLSPSDADRGSVFEARVEGDGVEPHLHRERHFDIAEVGATLEVAGLELIAAFGQQEGTPEMRLVQPPDELRDAKLIYFCRAA